MKTIDKKQLKKKKDSINDLTLINTLPAKHFGETKIEGSINVPQDKSDFVDRVKAAVNDNHKAEIVVYCANQKCDSSTKAAKKLLDAGFTNVWDYEEGAEGWNGPRVTTGNDVGVADA